MVLQNNNVLMMSSFSYAWVSWCPTTTREAKESCNGFAQFHFRVRRVLRYWKYDEIRVGTWNPSCKSAGMYNALSTAMGMSEKQLDCLSLAFTEFKTPSY